MKVYTVIVRIWPMEPKTGEKMNKNRLMWFRNRFYTGAVLGFSGN
jgi:hypothetical protein